MTSSHLAQAQELPCHLLQRVRCQLRLGRCRLLEALELLQLGLHCS